MACTPGTASTSHAAWDVDNRSGSWRRFRAAAREQRTTVVLGVEQHSGSQIFNTVLICVPDGSPPATYHKQYPISGAESKVTAGTDQLVLSTGSGQIGVAICADLGHPHLGRRYARAGAELLAVPALDFEVDDWSQSRVQLMRGVESGFSTARASRQGYLTLSDGYGRVLAETGSDDDGIATVSLSRDLALGNGPTWYARFGDVFSWLCVMIALGSVLGLVATRRRITKSSAH